MYEGCKNFNFKNKTNDRQLNENAHCRKKSEFNFEELHIIYIFT